MHSRLIACTALAAALLTGQPTPLGGSAELHELLDRLNTVGTVLMLGAHPDDENTAVMAHFARGRHLRTVYLSATRGEGGQNRIGAEQGALMGVIRTHELLRAREIDGGEQDFATVVDFGYSKTPQETLQVWGERTLLRDMVRSIRTFRPDVIVSRFPPKPGSGGHGHHTAVGWTGPQAFEAAADPARFPELGLAPWQVRRYYFNVFTFGRRMEESAARQPGQLRIDVGGYDPVLGKSYAEIAGESRSMHRSQAMGTSQRKGSVPAFFEHVAGEKATEDLLEGIDLGWSRVEGAEGVGRSLAAARAEFDPTRPGTILGHLLAAYRDLRGLEGPDAAYKLGELTRAIELAAGLWVDASADRWDAVSGESIEVTGAVLQRSDGGWKWLDALVGGVGTATVAGSGALRTNEVALRGAQVKIPADACYSQPHWLGDGSTGQPGCPSGSAVTPGPQPELVATFRLEAADGTQVEFRKPVLYRWVDPALGERSRPVTVVPPVTVAFTGQSRIFPDAQPITVAVRLASNSGAASGSVRLRTPEGWSVEPAELDVQFLRQGQEHVAKFEVTPPQAASSGELTASFSLGGHTIRSGMRSIAYDHIPPTVVFPRAAMRVERTDVELLSRQVGYVMGAGDMIPDALRQLGAEVTLLTAEDLTTGDLERFDAIITGVRALNVRPDLLGAKERMLDYVAGGGTLVVQYNTSSFRRSAGSGLTLAPYPMTPSRLRVTDERARVSFPNGPAHPLLSAPNRISAEDFDGWVQERGLYFMSAWDERYDTVLACADPGEEQLEGGLLYARHGKGAYVFTGYSWFRQLPAGVPGAFRIFANLISAGKAH